MGQVEILREGSAIPAENITVKNYVFNGKEYVLLKSIEDYHHIIKQSGLSTIRYARDYVWEGNHIQVEDAFRVRNLSESSYGDSNLKITINDKDWSVKSQIETRPDSSDENRYHGYFGILAVREKGIQKLVLVQRVSRPDVLKEQDLAWRTLSIEENGRVQEDRFTYAERGDIPQRVDFINHTHASPIAVGYRSNILQAWPLIPPILYPFGTALVGLVFILIGTFRAFMKLRRNRLS